MLQNIKSWIDDNIHQVYLGSVIIGVIVLIFALCWAEYATNRDAVGKTLPELIQTLGIPTRECNVDEHTKVVEWLRYHPGYSVRKAIFRNGVCVKCEGS
jgi:hypothetical protein